MNPHAFVGLFLVAAIGPALSPALAASSSDALAWPAPVTGFVPPKAQEHPRMLFRASDIPALRQRAATEDGKKILARLRETLGGGEALPELYAKEPPVNNADEGAINRHPEGTFTVGHSTGFAFLYTLTGDARYAQLARKCVELVLEGQVDRDSRYNWPVPGTGFRTGLVLQNLALTYDLCYDAWPADFRAMLVGKMQNTTFSTTKAKKYTLEDLAGGGGYPPSSNHFGAFLLGPAMVALATAGDPGSNDARMEKILGQVEGSMRKLIGGGFGDMGWFAEGTSCGRIAANNGVIPILQSLKTARGIDFIRSRPGARYTVLRLMHEIVSNGGNPQVPNRGDYGDNNLYKRNIISHMGDFAQGFGAVKAEEAEAMAWIYDTFVEAKGKTLYNVRFYPHLAVYAFVNWPAQTRDPNTVFPKVMADNTHGYYLARNRWRDGNDILVATLFKRGPGGYKSGAVRPGTFVWGLGEKFGFGRLGKATTHFRAAADGSMELADSEGNALAVDYSGASGAPALIVINGRGAVPANPKIQLTEFTVGEGVTLSVLTLSEGPHPLPVQSGAVISVGQQTVALADGKLSFKTFAPLQGN